MSSDELVCGQEVGTMCHFVHDIVTTAGAKILSFNAQHLRMIASSRKKTDKRDAYWITKCLQSGMMPHPVPIPTTEVRRLRSLLAQRRAIASERKRWMLRARSHLRAAGTPLAKGAGKITKRLEQVLACFRRIGYTSRRGSRAVRAPGAAASRGTATNREGSLWRSAAHRRREALAHDPGGGPVGRARDLRWGG